MFEPITEHQLQVLCVNWFRQEYSDKLIYSIPNGGQRNSFVGKKLKDEGVQKGVADLHCPFAGVYENKKYLSLYIELKNPKYKSEKALTTAQSPEQKGFETKITGLGNLYLLINQFGVFCDFINNYINNRLTKE